jgi:membrane-anchored protein YejM (alkaline phosphatase superfamily)
MSSEQLFPLYVPVHFERTAIRTFHLKPPPESHASGGESLLHYPISPLVIDPGAPRPDIIFIVVEGLRVDMLDPEVMPRISERASQWLRFDHHYSGGNATRFGIFSLLYGLHATYWDEFLNARREPLLFDVLRRRGYGFRVLTSSNVDYPEFRSTAFVKMHEAISDRWPGPRVDRDRLVADTFVSETKSRDQQPRFTFLFFDAPHGFYEFPPQFEKFTPVPRDGNYVELAKRDPAASRPLFNRYRNALLYTDSQIGRVLEAIDASGRLQNSIVVITGDHGEEFGEFGYFGHTSSFDRIQTRTPLLLHLPGRAAARFDHVTSHIDIVPTILQFAGVRNAATDYSNGQSLFSTSRQHAFVAGWKKGALTNDAETIIFRTDDYAPSLEVRDGNYRLIDDQNKVVRARSSELAKTAMELGRFYR